MHVKESAAGCGHGRPQESQREVRPRGSEQSRSEQPDSSVGDWTCEGADAQQGLAARRERRECGAPSSWPCKISVRAAAPPEDLLAALPNARPMGRGNLPHEVKPGTLHASVVLLLSLSMLEWDQLPNRRPSILAPGCSISEGPGPKASSGGGAAAGSGNPTGAYPIAETWTRRGSAGGAPH